MNKQEILKKIETSKLDLSKIIILSGASLVLQGVEETTNDIDVSCLKEYYDTLKWKTKKGAFDVEIKYKDVFEIGYNLYYPKDIVKVDGIPCLSLEKCLEIKEKLHREKDKTIIRKLKERL